MVSSGSRVTIYMGENPFSISNGVSSNSRSSSMGYSKKRKHRASKKRKSSSRSKRYKKVKGRRYTPHTAGKRKDRSHKRIRYTKRGQPYIIMGNGRAKFISYKSAHISHKRKGGRY